MTRGQITVVNSQWLSVQNGSNPVQTIQLVIVVTG